MDTDIENDILNNADILNGTDIESKESGSESDDAKEIIKAKKRILVQKKNETEDNGKFEEVPVNNPVLSSYELALGEIMVNSSKAKSELIDEAYNRHYIIII